MSLKPVELSKRQTTLNARVFISARMQKGKGNVERNVSSTNQFKVVAASQNLHSFSNDVVFVHLFGSRKHPALSPQSPSTIFFVILFETVLNEKTKAEQR